MFKKIAINARYFIAPLLILASLFGVIAGGPWVWTGVFLLGLGIIIDTLVYSKLWVLVLMRMVKQTQVQCYRI